MAVAVEGQGKAEAADGPLHQQEVAPGVLLWAEYGVGHSAGGIIHRQQQYESGPSVLEPAMMAAADLQQHALLGHPFPAHPVFGRTVLPGAEQARAVEETAYRLSAWVNALPLCQNLGQVAVVEAGVLLAGQVDHCGCDLPGN